MSAKRSSPTCANRKISGSARTDSKTGFIAVSNLQTAGSSRNKRQTGLNKPGDDARSQKLDFTDFRPVLCWIKQGFTVQPVIPLKYVL